MAVISAEISRLQERIAGTSLDNQGDLLGILTAVRDSVLEAAEEAQSGEPALAIDHVQKAKAKLQEFGQLLQDGDLTGTAKRLEERLDNLLTRYGVSARRLIGELLFREQNSYYVRKLPDRKKFGPPIIEDGHLQVYLKVRGGSAQDGGIDDLVATCGIWICPNDTCVCVEWECESDGPGGSFP